MIIKNGHIFTAQGRFMQADIKLEGDRIVEIAMIKYLPDGTRTVKRKLLNPQIPMPKLVIDIHGITDDMVKDEPRVADRRRIGRHVRRPRDRWR